VVRPHLYRRAVFIRAECPWTASQLYVVLFVGVEVQPRLVLCFGNPPGRERSNGNLSMVCLWDTVWSWRQG